MDLPLSLDRTSSATLQLQLSEQLRGAILDGRLSAGTRLSSTRSLAGSLGVSRNVVVAAYDELYAEGYIEGHHGSGTFVTHDLPPLPKRARPEPSGTPRWLRTAEPPAIETQDDDPNLIVFRLGRPSTALILPEAWRRAWSEVANQAPPSAYGTPYGDIGLRQAIADYLGRSRGVACGVDDIVITSGALQAVDLIARATLQPGDSVAFEEPGYPSARRVFEARGAEIIPVPVDEDGLRVEKLPTGALAPLLVYTTPSHQYPLGARLSLTRRLGLLAWAEQCDALIVEDDYDSEYRYDAPPLPALAGLDQSGRVVYVGTFSKVLSPALRVGYVVAPPPLRERIVRLKRLSDYHTPWPVQRAMAAFIGSGSLERHIRRARRHYAEKRRVVADAFRPVDHLAKLRGLDAGLHVFLELDPSIDANRVIQRARQAGVIVESIDEHYFGPQQTNGLLLGYGGLTMEQAALGSSILATAIAQEARAGQAARSCEVAEVHQRRGSADFEIPQAAGVVSVNAKG
jgi:GntR family transcriptional regulator/MocR family aminotransferase